MSSEYIYDRKAINLRGVKCDYTALFVKSHSSNDGEHTPRWKLYNFSKKIDAMCYPAQCAHYCESGLTRGIKGRAISGQYEIEAWRNAIRGACLLTENDRFTFVDLLFYDKPAASIDSRHTLNALAKLAENTGVILYQFVQNQLGSQLATKITLNLAAPKHVDLIWQAIDTIKVQSFWSASSDPVGLGPYVFFGAVKAALEQGYKFSVDSNPLTTQPEKVKTELLQKYLGNSFHKFDFPVDGQAVYKDRRIVVSNWACRVLSTDPDGWFCKKLAIMEKVQPGCAESAYRAYKRHINALPVTPVEQIGTVEVRPLDGQNTAAESETRVTWETLTGWELESAKAFFAKHTKNPETDAVYTSTDTEHLAALSMSNYVPCFIAVNSTVPA